MTVAQLWPSKSQGDYLRLFRQKICGSYNHDSSSTVAGERVKVTKAI